MSNVVTTYDQAQHCTALREPHGNRVAMDCPYTGKGEEFSPGELLQAALSGCMLISMGTLAQRAGLDITDTRVHVAIEATDKPTMRYTAIRVVINMPAGLAPRDRTRLERAAGSCPIKHSFDPSIPLTVTYEYPD